MQGNNYDDKQLSVLGRYAPALLTRDYQVSVGGPIKRDRMWFFFNYRSGGRRRCAARHLRQQERRRRRPSGPTSRISSRQGRLGTSSARSTSLRLTTQLTPKNKLMVFWDEQPQLRRRRLDRRRPLQLAEGRLDLRRQPDQRLLRSRTRTRPRPATTPATHQKVQQVKYTGTATSKLLLEAGFGTYISQWGYTERPGNPTDEPDSRAGADGADLRRQRQPRERARARAV